MKLEKRPAPVLMVQGTASHVGKSAIVTALCRIFRQDGRRVAPFKAQNMALESYVAVEGGEIGRAQAIQADAAGLDPSIHMNPILLKPEGDSRSQVIVNGRPIGRMLAREYHQYRRELWPIVTAAIARLRDAHDLVIAEGAGSPAEINLRETEIVNMRVARETDASVLLVGDIERGGVFASFLGTVELLQPEERALVLGFVINKFRGDRSILDPGLGQIEQRTGIPVLGVIPYLSELHLPAEDSLALDSMNLDSRPSGGTAGIVDVVVIRLPRIANFDDFAALAAEPAIGLRYVDHAEQIGRPDLIILPGSKTTVADLAWLRAAGMVAAIQSLRDAGTPVVGVCGGYQMLGLTIRDPEAVESDEPIVEGLGLLPIETTFVATKQTNHVSGRLLAGKGPFGYAAGARFEAYEIHMGLVDQRHAADPLALIDKRSGAPASEHDGAVSDDGMVVGTFCHGLLGNDAIRGSLVKWLYSRRGVPAPAVSAPGDRERQYDLLADAVRAALDLERLQSVCRL